MKSHIREYNAPPPPPPPPPHPPYPPMQEDRPGPPPAHFHIPSLHNDIRPSPTLARPHHSYPGDHPPSSSQSFYHSAESFGHIYDASPGGTHTLPPMGGYIPPMDTGEPDRQRMRMSMERARREEEWRGIHSGDEVEEEEGDDNSVARLGKRKRPTTVSCEVCKQRKVRCDRTQPSCGWCTRNKVSCEYRERKKPGLRAGYGRELEQRLDALEKKLLDQTKMLKRHEEVINTLKPPDGETVIKQDDSDAGFPESVASVGRDEEASPEDGDSPTGESPNAPKPPTSNTETSAILPEYPGHTPAPQPVVTPPPPIPAATWTALDPDLPPLPILQTLVSLFFKHINTWCPIFHEPLLTRQLFHATPGEPEAILMWAILSCTLRFHNDPSLSPADKTRYLSCAKTKVALYCLDNMTVRSIQALLLTSLDTAGRNRGCSARHALALLSRGVVELGLSVEHRTPSPEAPTSIYTLRTRLLDLPDTIEAESRRRVFWMVYLLDRYKTTASAFDFDLADHEFDRLLPCREDLWTATRRPETSFLSTVTTPRQRQPESQAQGSFAYYLEVLGLLAQVHKFLKKPVDIQIESDVKLWQSTFTQLSSTLSEWKTSLPTSFSDETLLDKIFTTKLSPNWIMLHVAYQTTIIRLNSSIAYPAAVSAHFHVSRVAGEKCLAAVSHIQKLAQWIVRRNCLSQYGPPLAFSLWVAARVIIVHGTTCTGDIPTAQLNFFTSTLRQMGTWWPVSMRYSDLLQRVLDEWREHGGGDGTKPVAVQILADMRRTAFDLDILLSRQLKNPAVPRGSCIRDSPYSGPSNSNQTQETLAVPAVPSSHQRHSPTPMRMTQNVDSSELVDVFSFFNYPRVDVDGYFQTGLDGNFMDPPGVGFPYLFQGNDGMIGPQGIINDGIYTQGPIQESGDWMYHADGTARS